MSRLLTVSRAAQLAGVPRGRLQRMIRNGELTCFDGLVDMDSLRAAFPELRLEDTGLFEQVSRIREEAFGRRVRERALPSAELLAQRLFAQSRELAEVRRHLQAYHALVVDTLATLRDAPAADCARETLAERLEAGLGRVLASEPTDELDAMTDLLRAVAAHVVVRPSGREFLVEGNDSILQAGLKAGLRLGYGCGGGNCGLCKARVVSGEVRQVGHADYRLSEAERRQGVVLMCNQAPLGDLVIETLEANGPADIPAQELVARVRALSPLGEDTLLLHLQTPRSDRLRFLAGQSVTLGLAAEDGDAQATWPLASCPCDDRNLLFHVARDPADPLATRLFDDGLKPGAALNVRGPLGEFVLEAERESLPVFVACDLGFAPIKSLIEHAISAEDDEDMLLIWAATRADGHYLANQCHAWADALDGFRFVPITAGDAQAAARAVLVALDEAAVRSASVAVSQLRPDSGSDPDRGASVAPLAREVYLAGPPEFLQRLHEGLLARGLGQSSIRMLAV